MKKPVAVCIHACLVLLARAACAGWSPDLVPETVVYDFRQEDLPAGPVTNWVSRGVKPKTATGMATKLPGPNGVLFTAGTTQHLAWASDYDAPWLHRWWVVIARAKLDNRDGNVPVLTVNGGADGATHRQPYVGFAGGTGKVRSILDNGTAVSQEGACVTTAAGWNIVVGYRRAGQYRARINGVEQAPVAFTGMQPSRGTTSYLGANDVAGESTLAADVAIDCVLVGQSELNDAQVDKLVGWAHWRVGRQDLLPAGHPYKQAPPDKLDANDSPSRFAFDMAAWTNWAEACAATKKATRGGVPPSLDDGKGNDYTVVFRDDFITDSVVDDCAGDPSAIWFCPTHMGNIIDVNAQTQKKSDTPSSYVHDAAGSGSLALRMLNVNGRWRSGAFSSVNKEGQGRSWDKGRFRIRCKFPRLAAPRPGFFPAFWSYGVEHLFLRTRNRVEMDYLEYDGLNGAWLNTTQHVHAKGVIPYSSPEILSGPDVRCKLAGMELNAKNNFTPPVEIYDGEYHVWEFRIEDDFSYVIVDDKEVVRVPTERWLLVRKYILVDWALDEKKGKAKPVAGQAYDLTIDWIEVQQRERDLAVVPAAFSGRPALAGARGAGKTITCTPHVTASQIEYRWYRNGEPIVGATGPTFVEDAGSAGQELRCHVRAVSLLNQPEAWTARLPQ